LLVSATVVENLVGSLMYASASVLFVAAYGVLCDDELLEIESATQEQVLASLMCTGWCCAPRWRRWSRAVSQLLGLWESRAVWFSLRENHASAVLTGYTCCETAQRTCGIAGSANGPTMSWI